MSALAPLSVPQICNLPRPDSVVGARTLSGFPTLSTMPPLMVQYDTFRDQLAIKYPVYGHALWEPNPGGLYHSIEVGDVGYTLHGKFLRLFNILLPADHPSHEKSGVPESHEPLKPSIADHIDRSTLGPKNFCSAGVTESADRAHGATQTSALG